MRAGRRGRRPRKPGPPRLSAPMRDVPHPDGVIFEFIIQGAFVRVAAVDEATGVEASIVADRSCTQDEMERLALAKLDWVMRGRKAPPQAGGSDVTYERPAETQSTPEDRGRFDYKA